MRYVFPVLLVMAALLACKGKKADQAAPAPSASQAMIAPSAGDAVPAPSASVALSDEAAKVPVKEDFEQQAKKTVTPDNLTQQVDSIEKEIKSDQQ